MKKNLLCLLLISLFGLFYLQPIYSSVPMNEKAGDPKHARPIKCLSVSTTGHFELLHPKSLREIMEAFKGVEYTHTYDLKNLTLEKMQEYDVVWIYNFTRWEDAQVTAIHISNLLASYVKAGGLLVESLYLQDVDQVTQFGLLGGAYITEGLSPFNQAEYISAGYANLGEVAYPNHPIMDGIKAVNTTSPSYVTTVREGATTLAYYAETKAPLISVFNNIVAINTSPIDLHVSMGVGSFLYGDAHRLFHNSFKWLFSNKYDITAPNGVDKLVAKPTPNGNVFDITLEWNNPSYAINGGVIGSLSSIAIYRDDVLVQTLSTNLTLGAQTSWKDENVPAGKHTYKIIPMDGEKKGYPISVKTYSGKDKPSAVTNINLAPKGNTGYLSWENDIYGQNQGWIDVASLTYKIVRLPGNIVVAEAHTQKTFTDNTISKKQRYSYIITPSTSNGEGASTTSEEMYLYTNGDIYMGTSDIRVCSGKFYGPEGPDSNYKINTVYALTIAPENPEEGKRIQVKFNSFDLNLRLSSYDKLLVFDGPDLSAKQISGSPFSGQQIPLALKQVRAGVNNTSGALTFGFLSDNSGVGKGWDADISCIQLSDKDLAVVSVNGNVLPKVGTSSVYDVVIKNEGLASQSGFQLFFKEATTLIESKTINTTLASGDTIHIQFTWTPTTAKSVSLNVSINEDGNLDNNKYSLPVNVQTATTTTTEIRHFKDLSSMFVPFNFFYKTGVTQSIYHPDEINLAKGKITAIRYYNTFLNDVLNEKVIIYLTETKNTDLSKGWIPKAQMKKVFEGIVNFPSGENEITLPLDSAFDYKGGNLVVSAEHPMSQYSYTIADAFYVNWDDESSFRSIRYTSNTTPFNEKIAPLDDKHNNSYPQVLFAMDVKDAAGLKGVITTNGQPLDSVLIQVKGSVFYTYTNEKGEYYFPSLNTGTYTLKCSRYSYTTLEVTEVKLEDKTIVAKNISMDELPKLTLSGIVADNERNVLEGAKIELSGYAKYEGTTNSSGMFSIPKIYANQNYTITVSKDRFTSFKVNFNVTKDTNLAITLNQIMYPPVELSTQKSPADNTIKVQWKDPADMTFSRLVYDNGIATTAYGVRPEKEGWFGSVFTSKDSGVIESVDIFGIHHPYLPEGHAGSAVRIDLFDAHRQIIASSKMFKLTPEEWTNVPLNFVKYPETFYVMVHFFPGAEDAFSHHIGGDENGPSANSQTNYYTDGFAWGVVQSVSNVDPFAFMIRANIFSDKGAVQLMPGTQNEQPSYLKDMNITPKAKAKAKAAIEVSKVKKPYPSNLTHNHIQSSPAKILAAKFSVYRFPEEKKNLPAEWTLLTPNTITEKMFQDNAFGAQPQGVYAYAVKSVYSSELVSEAAVSDLVYKDMETVLNLTIKANISVTTSEGALVRLINQEKKEYTYTGTLDAEGKITFPTVWKGKYDFKVSKLGFMNIDTVLTLDKEASYTIDNFNFLELKTAPYNLKVLGNDNTNGEYVFSWNESKTIEEGFESHSDFEINSPGKIGWSYVDGDKKENYSIGGVTYPNQNGPMAYIIMNPSQTTPRIETLEGLPYKGKKYLAAFASPSNQCNDWIISPELNYTNEFTFSFWARSFSSDGGLERIQIGYSTSGKAEDDFTWIQGGSYLSLPQRWAEYSWTIPSQAKYVAIRSIGYATYMLMIDEITIGKEKAGDGRIKGFKVFLDGVEVAQTNSKEYTFTNILNPETQTAGVKAIYESGESKMSEIKFVTVKNEDEAFAKSLHVYPNPAQDYIYINGLTQTATYEILTTFGSKIKTGQTTNTQEQISISDLSSGTYIIRVVSTKGTAVKRFIKK